PSPQQAPVGLGLGLGPAPASSPVVQVRCPACGMGTMATRGQPSVCFSCGQPLSADLSKGGGGAGDASRFPDGGELNAKPSVQTPNVFGLQRSPDGPPSAATIRGPAGQFTIRVGSEVRVGRDPAQCPIFLGEPRVSGVHATLKLDGGQLMVRDETSNNGTWISGSRIAPGGWTPVPSGSPLRFGPVEFTVQLEA
ncbi:MAG: FHA domain-containing protein, partial [Myxococcota bacterium]|nr:FHA domain-containing protein [Myxococcota bacterium]